MIILTSIFINIININNNYNNYSFLIDIKMMKL